MPKQSRSEATYRRLLAAGETCFARRGYEAVSVADICAEAGVTKGAFYHHFPSKQALFLAVLNGWVARLETQLATALAAAADLPTALQAMGETAAQALQDARGKLPLFLAFWHEAAHNPAVWEATITPFRRFEGLLADYLRRGEREGHLVVDDAEMAARALVALGVGILLEATLLPDTEDRADLLRRGIEWLLRGMDTRKETE